MKQIVPTNCQVTKLCWKYHSASLVNAGTKIITCVSTS